VFVDSPRIIARFLSSKGGGAISTVLREGRKYYDEGRLGGWWVNVRGDELCGVGAREGCEL
jgi:hypothetical protein